MTALIRAGGLLERKDDARSVWDGAVATLRAQGIGMVNYLTSDTHRDDVRVLTTDPALYAGTEPDQDPFLHYCCHSYEPTLTGSAHLADHDYLPDAARAFILRAADLGFTSGVAIPMRLHGSHRFGGFNLLTNLDRAAFRARIVPRFEELRLFCLLVHRRLEELGLHATVVSPGFRGLLVAPAGGPLDGLSPREREVIYLVSRGMSRKECAQICTISQHTVAEYIKSAYRKLGVNNRVEAARLMMDAERSFQADQLREGVMIDPPDGRVAERKSIRRVNP